MKAPPSVCRACSRAGSAAWTPRLLQARNRGGKLRAEAGSRQGLRLCEPGSMCPHKSLQRQKQALGLRAFQQDRGPGSVGRGPGRKGCALARPGPQRQGQGEAGVESKGQSWLPLAARPSRPRARMEWTSLRRPLSAHWQAACPGWCPGEAGRPGGFCLHCWRHSGRLACSCRRGHGEGGGSPVPTPRPEALGAQGSTTLLAHSVFAEPFVGARTQVGIPGGQDRPGPAQGAPSLAGGTVQCCGDRHSEWEP